MDLDSRALVEPVVLPRLTNGCTGSGSRGLGQGNRRRALTISDFEPVEWAEPTMDDAMLLGQE
jgi:hypothetical protein